MKHPLPRPDVLPPASPWWKIFLCSRVFRHRDTPSGLGLHFLPGGLVCAACGASYHWPPRPPATPGA